MKKRIKIIAFLAVFILLLSLSVISAFAASCSHSWHPYPPASKDFHVMISGDYYHIYSYCEECGAQNYVEYPIDCDEYGDGHLFVPGENESRVEPTCSKAGGIYRTCVLCNEAQELVEKLPALVDSHVWTWVTTKTPTCVENGSKYPLCDECGATGDVVSIQATGNHSYANGMCQSCGKACDHSYVEGVCKKCGFSCSHAFEGGVCLECGSSCEHLYDEGVCKKCGISCAHSKYGEWSIEQAPTCSVVGKKARTCLVCGDVNREAIPTVSHTWQDGVCAVCGAFQGGNISDGSSYAQGYADAMNTFNNSVIEQAPIQGLIQGMWYGVLAMVTILGNGISIGGISLFSIVISLLILVVVAFVLKLLFKGAG